jgi:hypothetical protein
MKKGLLTITAFLALTTTNAQVVYTENFEAADTWTAEQAWSAMDVDGDGKNWGLYDMSEDATFGALGIAPGSNSWDTNALTPDNYFISPAIDLSAVTELSLSFDYAAIDPDWAGENFSVYAVAVDGANTLTVALGTATPLHTETISTGGVIYNQTVDISSLSGSDSVYVVFRHHDCTDMYILVIDNISITSSASVNTMALNTKAFPNPAAEELNIELKSDMASVSIVSMDGKVISTQDANGTATKVNVGGLTSGVYMYQITTAKGEVVTNTFVKK